MKRRHILIAEDEEHARLSIGITLSEAGFNVSEAENGREALDRLLESNYSDDPVDLLITDIQMPELSGLELIDRLNAMETDIPVIGITGYGNKEVVVELLRRGCKEYLDKPFLPREVVGCVENVLHSHAMAEIEQIIKKDRNIEADKARLNCAIQGYRNNLERLIGQIDSAVDTYQDLLSIIMDNE